LKAQDISNLLQELKRANNIEYVGSSKKGHWKIRKVNEAMRHNGSNKKTKWLLN
jgi:hypothetical protein